MTLAFICHRWHGDPKYETQTKLICSELALHSSIIPISTALLFNGFLDDNDEKQRQVGITCGLSILKNCDILFLYAKDGISEGMKREIEFASKRHIPIEVKHEM